MTLADFLAWEETQPDRHEFVRGEVFAMVGARRVHGIVSLKIASGLKSLPRGSRCQVFTESMKLKVGDDVLVYPERLRHLSIGCSLPADEIFDRLDPLVQGTLPGV